VRGRWIAWILALCASSIHATAQTPLPLPAEGRIALAPQAEAVPPAQASAASDAPSVEFLPQFDFHIALDKLSGDDPRFVWSSHVGGNLHVLRYKRLRFVMVADYEAQLGREYQPFDPNQGNYTLGGFVAGTVRGVEVSGVMHHVSRHLGDRPKLFGIAWNMYGARLRSVWTDGPAWLESRVDLRGATQHAYVDYDWELDAGLRGRYRLRPLTQIIAVANLRRVGVDGSRNRGDQTGFRAEAGVRFEGTAAALEVFGGVERRIDPYQLEFGTATWALAGLRIVRR
jgi:hypothetical protein